MGRRRARRLRNFGIRAEAFIGNIIKDGVGKQVKLDGCNVKIGTGQHRRLIIKNHPSETRMAESKYIKMAAAVAINPPKHFVLVPVKSANHGAVQEYFNRPSVASLTNYFTYRRMLEGKQPFYLPKFLGEDEKKSYIEWFEKSSKDLLKTKKSALLSVEDALRCKKFLGEYKSAREESLVAAINEFESALGGFNHANIVVLGMQKDGKFRFAVVDL